MTDKKPIIKPKIWPKEYTFEEFQSLNPTISEGILINYYNKYLEDYAQNYSRHIKHFNDTKKHLSEEIKGLKNTWNFQAYDSMVDGGEGGRGRYYISDKYSNNSLDFSTDGTNDYAITTKASALKPELFTISIWFKLDSYSAPIAATTLIDNYRTPSYGWEINIGANGRINGMFRSAKTDTTYSMASGYRDILIDNPARYYYANSTGNGWYNIVVTMDGRYLKMYINGELDGSGGTATGGSSEYISDGVVDLDGATGHTVKYGNPDSQLCVLGGHLTGTTTGAGTLDGLMDEIALWSTALDASTIKTLYNDGVPKHNLSFSTVNTDSRDGHDFYKPYVNNLIAWWRFEEGSGTTSKDSSPSGNDLVLKNDMSFSTSTPE